MVIKTFLNLSNKALFVLLVEEIEKVNQQSTGMKEPRDGLNNSIANKQDYYLYN